MYIRRRVGSELLCSEGMSSSKYMPPSQTCGSAMGPHSASANSLPGAPIFLEISSLTHCCCPSATIKVTFFSLNPSRSKTPLNESAVCTTVGSSLKQLCEMVTRDAVDMDRDCLMPEEGVCRRCFSVTGRWWSSDFLRGSEKASERGNQEEMLGAIWKQ